MTVAPYGQEGRVALYPIERIYSIKAHDEWRRVDPPGRHGDGDVHRVDGDLKEFRQSWEDVRDGPFWEVSSWDDLRAAVSFLTLMNKREVLYFRGQQQHYNEKRLLPVLFREDWQIQQQPERYKLCPENRGQYYALIPQLRDDVLKVARRVGTPRTYVLGHVPAATAAILQHYGLWPTHFIDLTRSLPTAVAFASGRGEEGFLYVVAMPDLRGSITSDIDQHITLSRLEAICPPGAKRPHHQDSYLVSRFPEPEGGAQPRDDSWKDWQEKTDLMHRLVAKFRLRLQGGTLLGALRIDDSFLLPRFTDDEFGRVLTESLLSTVESHARRLALLVPSPESQG